MGYKAGTCSFSKAVPDVSNNREIWPLWKKIPTDFIAFRGLDAGVVKGQR